MTKFHTRFSKRIAGETIACTEEERKTKSEFADECDINRIMARYRKTGELPQNALRNAADFGDFSQIPTYHDMVNKVFAANELFQSLPANVRKVFDNDPGAFIAAADDPEGRAYLVKLGLGKAEAIRGLSSASHAFSASSSGQDEEAGTEPAVAPQKGAHKKKAKPSSDQSDQD